MTYIQPGLTVVLLLLLWAWRSTDVRKKNRRILAAAILLFLWSWPPMGWLLLHTLESGYLPQPPQLSTDVQAIVVASGGGEIVSRPAFDVQIAEDTTTRVRYAAWLYHHWNPVPVVVSGGNIVGPTGQIATMAGAMDQALQNLKVPASAIIQETESTSTYENAVFSARILKARGIQTIALVTEAFHIRRTAAAFRKAGLNVIPAPCGFRTVEPLSGISDWFPNARGIRWNEMVVHEWLGSAWYKLRGRI